jgi:DNA-binding NarL/FixJ family response regulator
VVTVGIVEDDPILRDALRELIGAVEDFRVTDAVGTLADGVALLAKAPDVLLLDLALPDGSGLDLIAQARSTGSRTKVIVITVFGDVRNVVQAIEEGADGYLLKESDQTHVADAIRTVLNGGAPISPAVASHILARVRDDSKSKSREAQPSSRVALTAKETQVLESLAHGKSFKEVAAQQAISLHTVGDHVKAIYRKLSVNSRGEAVFKAMQTGLITLSETDERPKR